MYNTYMHTLKWVFWVSIIEVFGGDPLRLAPGLEYCKVQCAHFYVFIRSASMDMRLYIKRRLLEKCVFVNAVLLSRKRCVNNAVDRPQLPCHVTSAIAEFTLFTRANDE